MYQRRHFSSSSQVDNALYEPLGVARTATKEDITKAWKRLAAVNHPDKGGSKEKMQEINVAYEILNNPEKRRVYDLGGVAGVQQQQQQQSANSAQSQAANDIFQRMFFGANGPGAETSGGGMPRMFTFQFGGGGFESMGGGGMEGMFARNFAAQGGMMQEQQIQHVVNVTMQQVFMQEPIQIEIDVKRRKGGTIVMDKHKVKISCKSWLDVRQPIIMAGKGNQNVNEKIKDGDIIIKLNLITGDTYVPCNSHDLILKKTISFEDSLCGFQFSVPFIDSAKTELSFSNKDKKEEVIQPGTVYKCPCGLFQKEMVAPFSFDVNKINYNDFGTMYVVLDVQEVETMNSTERARLAARLTTLSTSSDEKPVLNAVSMTRAPPHIEMQLASDVWNRKAEVRATLRQNL